jgi:acetyl-CoA carboxylase biotin carboxyl carrier protein
MDLQYLRKLIKLVLDSGIEEIEVEEQGNRVRITRSGIASGTPVYSHVQAMPVHAPATPAAGNVESSKADSGESKASENANQHIVRSPIVGTFYRAPAPDAEPYVQVGQHVTKGMPIAIIEAMKIMNEIESDAEGKVVRILVENGMPVEYNQPMIVLEV